MVFFILEFSFICSVADFLFSFFLHVLVFALPILYSNFSQGIYPLKDVFIRKVKLLKAPKFDISKLNEAHEGTEDTGRKVSA